MIYTVAKYMVVFLLATTYGLPTDMPSHALAKDDDFESVKAMDAALSKDDEKRELAEVIAALSKDDEKRKLAEMNLDADENKVKEAFSCLPNCWENVRDEGAREAIKQLEEWKVRQSAWNAKRWEVQKTLQKAVFMLYKQVMGK